MTILFQGNTLWFCGHGKPERKSAGDFEANSPRKGGGDGHSRYLVPFWSRLPNQGWWRSVLQILWVFWWIGEVSVRDFCILLSLDEEDDIFTLGEIKDRIESTDDDRWKTFFAEVETIEVEQIEDSLNVENRQSTTPTVHSTTSDDIRYDLTFFTPSGLEVRVKVIWTFSKSFFLPGWGYCRL